MEVRQETEVHFLFGTVILRLLSIFKKRQASHLRSIEFRVPLEGSKGCEDPFPDEAENCGFL